jgi:K+/H+ antiporter YhaU regulatory subunit KhtT
MLPDIFIGLPYGSLFTYLVENYHCTPIGIYRKCFDGKSFQYVILNPSPSNSIQESDSLYLLGTSIPTWDE